MHFRIGPVVCTGVHSSLLLGSFPSYGCLFNRSSVEGQLGCSQVGAVMNSPALNIRIEVFVGPSVLIFLGPVYLEGRLLGHMVSVCLIL